MIGEAGRWKTLEIVGALDALGVEFAAKCNPALLHERARNVLEHPITTTIVGNVQVPDFSSSPPPIILQDSLGRQK